MCGIFGVFVNKQANLDPAFIRRTLMTIARLSESRGKDSSGLVLRNEAASSFHVTKGAVPVKYLLQQPGVVSEIKSAVQRNGHQHTFAAMGHSRLVTNGTQVQDVNNQPVVKDGVIAIHNGIIVNYDALWAKNPDIGREYEIDTEIMLSLIRKYLKEGGTVPASVSKTINQLVGTVAAAFMLEDMGRLALATNNGSLYILTDQKDMLVFASEEYFLTALAEKVGIDLKGAYEIRQVRAGTGYVLDLDQFVLEPFSFCDDPAQGTVPVQAPYPIEISSVSDGRPQLELILDPARIAAHPGAAAESKVLEYNFDEISALRRCSKCILPETFPFINFDASGVCNYCREYKLKNHPKPLDELMQLVEPYRRSGGKHDVIIPYSGGRDSTHTLHIAKNVLGLNPVAFTYDWGMVNDLARRNIARVCGKLGVENILVSADISWKRGNIRRNVLAWLKRPHLGIVPLFMAGDKFFYYYCDQVKRQTGIDLNIWGINPLENTDFKVGFMGVRPDFDKEHIYSLSVQRQLKLFTEMGKNIVLNPAYINRSLIDSMGSFVSRSIVPHRDYYHLYDYYRWDEEEVDSLVLEHYEWERAIDTRTTWRIGDGTAPFYNYIYYTTAGFSEYDTFRSNQIREGAMTREHALELVNDENRPRYPYLKWYTDIIGIDFESTIKRINTIPKRYRTAA